MLSGVDLRVLHCVLDRRLRAVLFGGGRRGVCGAQHAFQRHRGCDGVLAAFAGAVTAAGDGLPLHALLVDLSKCYDVVSHQCMAAIFREMGMPPCFSDHVLSTLRDSRCSLRTAFGLAEPFGRANGIPQGDCLAVTLSLLYLDPLVAALHELREEVLAQADDVTAISGSVEGVARMLDVCCEWCRDVGATLNPTKTVWLYRGPPAALPDTIASGDVCIRRADSAKLLGVRFSGSDRLAHAKELLAELRARAARRTAAVRDPEARVFYLRELVMPQWTYGALAFEEGSLALQ
eukprot:gene5532-5115_t